MATNSSFERRSTRQAVRTTDATPTVALEIIMDDQTAGVLVVTAVCAATNRSTVYARGVRQTYRRNGASVALAGAAAAIFGDGDAGLGAVAVALGTSGAKVQVTVTGIGATTLDWMVIADWVVH